MLVTDIMRKKLAKLRLVLRMIGLALGAGSAPSDESSYVYSRGDQSSYIDHVMESPMLDSNLM